MRPTRRADRALQYAVKNWKRANRMSPTLDEQIANTKRFLEDLPAIKPTPDREQGLQLCIQPVEKELRRLEGNGIPKVSNPQTMTGPDRLPRIH